MATPSDRANEHQALSATETARMLDLCAAQIDGALRECDTAVEKLLESFTAVIDDAQWFWRSANGPAMPGKPTDNESPMTVEVTARSARLVARANSAIHALQFHDRLTQRLEHVRHSLKALGELVVDAERSAGRDHWNELHAQLGRLYRTREEVAIFEALSGMQTRPPAEKSPPACAGSEIELF